MNTRKLFKLLNYGLGIVSVCFLLTSNAYAEWYTGKVHQVVPRSASGDTFIQVKPGTNETRFVGVARIIVLGQDPGANKLMAVFLSAIALNTEITFEVIDVPSWATPQVTTSAGMVAP